MQYTVRFFGVLAMNLGVPSGGAVVLELPENAVYGDVLDGIREKFAGRLPPPMWDEEAGCLHRGILAFGADGSSWPGTGTSLSPGEGRSGSIFPCREARNPGR
jgi:hypothetical protein